MFGTGLHLAGASPHRAKFIPVVLHYLARCQLNVLNVPQYFIYLIKAFD